MMKKTILVTGTGGRSVGAGIVHALTRSSREVAARWTVIAADADPFAWGLYKADHGVLLPHCGRSDYISSVARVVRRFKVDAIIPGTEIEIGPLLDNAERLRPAIVLANRQDLLPLMLDKFFLARKLAEFGLPTIPTLPADQWKELAARFGFPLIVKPTRGTGGSRGLRLVSGEDEMAAILEHLDGSTMPCVQPYVGTGDQEYTVGVLHDREGNLIDSIVMRRKLLGLSLLTSSRHDGRSCAVSTGYSQGFIIRHREIQSFCEELATRLGSRGPLNIQLRYDEATCTPYVFEVHPRFSGTTPIRADVGFHEVDWLLRNHLFQESFGRQVYRTNVAAIRAFEHVIVPIEEMLQWDEQ